MTPQPTKYAREPDAITVEPKVKTRIRSYWWGNFDIAMDGTGFRSANDVYGRIFTSTDSATYG